MKLYLKVKSSTVLLLLLLITVVKTHKEYNTQVANYTSINQYLRGVGINLF